MKISSIIAIFRSLLTLTETQKLSDVCRIGQVSKNRGVGKSVSNYAQIEETKVLRTC